MKGLGAFMALAYITPMANRIREEREMALIYRSKAVNMGGFLSQGGLR
jgi:hypothetical protein